MGLTKTAFLASVLSLWGDITSPKRLPIKDRQVADLIVDEVYADAVSDTGVAPNNTITTKQTIGGVTFSYSFKFRKSGNIVHVTGRIAVTTGSSINDAVVAQLNSSEFYPITGNAIVFLDKENTSGQSLQLIINSTSGTITAKHTAGTLDSGIGYIANFFYFTNE